MGGDNLEKWKDFTKDLMASNGKNGVNGHGNAKNSRDDDDMLSDLFGDIKREETNTKKDENVTTSSRASALMDTIPDFMQNNSESTEADDDKWPWQQKLDAL